MNFTDHTSEIEAVATRLLSFKWAIIPDSKEVIVSDIYNQWPLIVKGYRPSKGTLMSYMSRTMQNLYKRKAHTDRDLRQSKNIAEIEDISDNNKDAKAIENSLADIAEYCSPEQYQWLLRHYRQGPMLSAKQDGISWRRYHNKLKYLLETIRERYNGR